MPKLPPPTRSYVPPVILLSLLTRARTALELGESVLGRRYIDDALARLQRASDEQGAALDVWARTPESREQRDP